MEVSENFGYDENGVKKPSVYFESKHNFKPNLGDDMNKRVHEYHQSMRGGDVFFVATTTKNKQNQLFSTEISPRHLRGKSSANDVTKTQSLKRKSRIFKANLRDNMNPSKVVFNSKDFSPARQGAYCPALASRFESRTLEEEELLC